MSNSFFHFKRFSIWQDRCAMKVSTDACILGAWTPLETAPSRVLDVGAGTGLLSLMLAQRLPEAQIHALELEPLAAAQAAENVAASPFANRIQVTQTDASQWTAPALFDLVIVNPPFFKNALTGPDAARNAARHTGTLNAASLAMIIGNSLNAGGIAAVLWPPAEHAYFEKVMVQAGFFLHDSCSISHRAGSAVTRVIGIYKKEFPAGAIRAQTLAIRDENDRYTPAFATLLSPFYLQL